MGALSKRIRRQQMSRDVRVAIIYALGVSSGILIGMVEQGEMRFADRVIKRMRGEGWHVERVSKDDVVDLFCTRGDHYRTGVRVKPHGRIYDKEWEALRQYGIENNVHVLYAHESYGRAIAFVKVYPK